MVPFNKVFQRGCSLEAGFTLPRQALEFYKILLRDLHVVEPYQSSPLADLEETLLHYPVDSCATHQAKRDLAPLYKCAYIHRELVYALLVPALNQLPVESFHQYSLVLAGWEGLHDDVKTVSGSPDKLLRMRRHKYREITLTLVVKKDS